MTRLAIILIAAALTGCGHIASRQVPDWPQLTIREYPGENLHCWNVMSAPMKALHVALLAPPAGCSWINLCTKTCDVYYPAHHVPCPDMDFGCLGAAAIREHEIGHCRGDIHPVMEESEHFQYWRAGNCNASKETS